MLANLNHRANELCQSALDQFAPDTISNVSDQIGTAATVIDFSPDSASPSRQAHDTKNDTNKLQDSRAIQAGLLLARICLSDLAKVSMISSKEDTETDTRPDTPDQATLDHPTTVQPDDLAVRVETDSPLLACIASQYAGFPLSVADYFALCSGPARTVRGKEDILKTYTLVQQTASHVVGVLESGQLPTNEVIETFAQQCGTEVENVTLCTARTASYAGSIQIVSRSVETAMHKLHETGFDLRNIRRAIGTAPLPPIANNDLQSLGWTNDAILYGGQIELWIDNQSDEQIQTLGAKIPSSSSTEFGRPFIEIFDQYERDFYKIDKSLFSPARVTFHNLQSKNSFSFGEPRPDILVHSFQSA